MSRDMEFMTDNALIPNPLRIALDVARRLRPALSGRMTPDQRRGNRSQAETPKNRAFSGADVPKS